MRTRYRRKIYSVTGSKVFTIPKAFVDAMGLRSGDKVYLYLDTRRKRVVVAPRHIDEYGFPRVRRVVKTTSKWGVSYRLCIPKRYAEELGLNVGDRVTVELRDGKIYVRKTVSRKPVLSYLASS